MKAMTRLTRRTALLTAAVAIAMLVVASPAAAHAKTTTRIVVAGRTVDNSVDGASVWPVQLPAKVQKLTAGKWVTVSGTIRISRYNLTTQKYDFISSKSGKGVSFTITRRGKFRLQFLTTGALKAATNYATLREDIGLTIIAPQPGDFDISGSGGTSLVTATYVVHWNTAASVPPVTMAYEGYFSSFQGADASWTDGVWVYQERNISAPGTVRFIYYVDDADVLQYLHTWGNAYVDGSDWDPYIVGAQTGEYVVWGWPYNT